MIRTAMLQTLGRWIWHGSFVPGLAVGLCLCCNAQSSLSLPPATIDAGTTTYQAPVTVSNATTFIIEPGTVNVTFTGGTSVVLNPGFHATASSAGITFHAFINPAVQSLPPGITSTNIPPASAPTKEYIYMNGKVVVVERLPD